MFLNKLVNETISISSYKSNSQSCEQRSKKWKRKSKMKLYENFHYLLPNRVKSNSFRKEAE